MNILRDPINIVEMRKMAVSKFGLMVKAVVDVEKEIMAVYGDLHADEEKLLIEDGSEQHNLWGINIYPEESGDNLVEFDSMINIRPVMDNMTRSVENPVTREKIIKIVKKLIKK
ncbi:hypothetical protein A3D05_03615 [Candidatus Gottesmanbacteria bacterium RIFCSPHIGHO2_02_FULL_40_24]|uniref:Uncharacterized protein n=1 Tax=Candidatus Gottesmanbacteria bacterium RIFCSPHIGHO2_01_FULL_40_15 TaxID=1798376 RepID=A0A1F5Z1M0_9BACT|nr:MAG: hypothetical protein A2777_06500 [Candidatus Gottesmanbacteria bacterium RIFCSPHIGHO2_01_FULL_40_15]OGG16967.1 MAG: hypothetical protein A3D05_03615 [Candidatus Gottesmanbacteria bacterium RIFCSPHIGHO2_02_FULL_40_24]OGG20984.1 MAG: hypothetical protein A3B48_01470 [Candidatus Gottesmanbacteria bacterium RIFCSPLOWO2_01_FULL_40_10]OGG23356.1 MAG: hypothetical protein A3E42_03105 [Candidatus Gottesmanbacteria bacterium RIFCSPHIGHO2_12_FULL_40_13]OGG34016.1 MAG: hypothetical protein A3I80_0